MNQKRREFLWQTAATGAAISLSMLSSGAISVAQSLIHRRRDLRLAAIGVGGSRGAHSQGTSIALQAKQYATLTAVCDVDELHMEEFNAKCGDKLKRYTDYRQLLEKERPDAVTIGTPDHWHVPIAIAALNAGCDVYCEKPLTLTIEEGKRIRVAAMESGRVFQVGTQQRSNLGFLEAIAIVQSGLLGKKVNADVAIGGGELGGPFQRATIPINLNWDMWIGPAAVADYSPACCKGFRWYFDYSGGKLTDWGAHHIDIAQWAMGHQHTGPVKVTPIGASRSTSIVPDNFDWQSYLAGETALSNGFHTAAEFHIRLDFADGSMINVHDEYESEDSKTKFSNGILFTGENGRIFVNRERLNGKPIENMSRADRTSMLQSVISLYKGRWPGDHMGNFFECIADRSEPVSDVNSHVRTMASCHLSNIALMLGCPLTWNPETEQFVADEEATAFLERLRRRKYSLEATT
jgi:myo-inositol 2-dehydrogenase / D-chiro-inositol 1-dehydrogenase